MLSFLTSLFDQQAKTLKRYEKIVMFIGSFEESLKKLSDSKLKAKTEEFKKRLQDGETLEQILPEAYAVVRETARRQLGQRHFDVQLMAGIAFHEGKVAEQKTGEGKTLSATTALYLNALEGKGSHLVTVNDYLAQVGAGWMGAVYHALGLTVSVIGHEVSYLYDPEFTGEERGDERLEHFKPVTRKEAYDADITYGTNNEFGFDYLRDNMAQRLEDQVQREHHYAIVDEADSILIDEARTPLIISAPDTEPTEKYARFSKLVTQLAPRADYVVDEKMKTAVLTDLGVKRLERLLGVANLYEEDFDTIHHVEQALKAHTVYQRDVDYVVRENEVVIVDEHTGRLMFGRRYSDGLHQALEAKEAVKIQQESRTLATISLQNYFRLYSKLAGMSGTAATEAEEFQQIYTMDVLQIPTNMPTNRIDAPDVVYKTQRAKYAAILREVEEIHATGRPILIGTRSIEQNQVLGSLLQRNKIPHQVLNAKNHEKEAFIIAETGKRGAITVATNIAGRGVDIILGGAQPEHRQFEDEKAYEKAKDQWKRDHEEVVGLGGLHIIGATRHEARRIDNQLRGRAGRQGDPGSSRFFVSLEDEIMRLFGGEQIQRLMDTLHIDENMPIEHGLITKAITQAQIKVEGFFFDQRKNLVQYDDVMNRQREIIYKRRKAMLQSIAQKEDGQTSKELKKRVAETFEKTASGLLDAAQEAAGSGSINAESLTHELAEIIPFDGDSLKRIREQIENQTNNSERLETLQKIFTDIYKLREDMYGENVMRDIELFVYLSTLDENWMDHLDAMTNLRDTIWLRGSKEQSLAEYKKEAFELFSALIDRIEVTALRRIFRVEARPVAQAPQPTAMQYSGPAEQVDQLASDQTTPADVNTDALARALAGGTNNLATPKKSSKIKKKKNRKKGSYL